MGRIEWIAAAVAAILAREGIDYLQSKAVFKVARQKAGLTAPPDLLIASLNEPEC